MGNAARDQNYVPTLTGVSNADGSTPVTVYVDPTTHRLLVSSSGGGSGTVTEVSVVTANGVSGVVANATTTPAITLTLGAITPTSVNGLTITSTTGTLTVTNGKTLSVSNTLTFTGTDSSSVAFGAGGTVAYTANKLSVFAATTSAELAGVISDETGSGALVFASSPSLTTPTLGVATATSLNGLTVTTSTGTLTIANGSTLATSGANSITLTSTAATNVTLPTTGTLATLAGTETFTNKRITARVQSVSDAATVTPNADSDDCVDITAIAQAFTIANPSGTPTNFQKLIIRIKDNGTARAISFGTAYVAGGVSLPTTTVISKILTLGFIYNSANSLNKWQLVASAQEA